MTQIRVPGRTLLGGLVLAGLFANLSLLADVPWLSDDEIGQRASGLVEIDQAVNKDDEAKDDEAKDGDDTEGANAKELAAVQGKWIRSVETDGGTFKILKEHFGNKTKLTVYGPKGKVFEEKTSEFRLEIRNNVRVFKFFNNRFTAGPNKGRMVKAPASYIYRVAGDTFFEIRGMLIGDDSAPSVTTWKRFRIDDLPLQPIG
ncbi:MAG: hypothetical protein AAGG48_31715 [Planctomycetota bacterium]